MESAVYTFDLKSNIKIMTLFHHYYYCKKRLKENTLKMLKVYLELCAC